MMRFVRGLMLAVLLLGSGGNAESAPAAPLRVAVSVLPQKYFVERVGGERVRVAVLVGPGQNPHSYEPSPKQMTDLAQADIYFRTGVAFEDAWMDRIRGVNPQMRVIDLRTGLPLRTQPQDAGGASHRHEGGADPHIWTSPPLVKHMAGTIRDALIELDPGGRGKYQANHTRFAADLHRLDQDIRQALEGVERRRFMVFHPSWGYFADTYGLEQVAIETEGKEPGARTLAALIDRARGEGIRVIFVQRQFPRRNAETIAQAIGGTVVAVDPLAEDYLHNLRSVAAAFAQALQ